MKRPVELLGAQVAKAQDDQLARDGVADQARARFAASRKKSSARPPPRRSLVVLGGLSALAAAIALIVVADGGRPLAVQTPGIAVDQWVGMESVEQPIAFSDGSSVLLRRGARARINRLERDGARVALERGSVAVAVRHNRSTLWLFQAGPYDVQVTGTRFDLEWQPETRQLELVMHDGSVRVTGPMLAEPRTVVAGERLALGTPAPVELPAGPEALEPEPKPAVAVHDAEMVKERLPRPRRVAEAPAVVARPDWRALAAEGRYAEALSLARPAFSSLAEQESAADVLLLGDLARLGGDRALAQAAYRQVRRRFEGSGSAAEASFSLGRIAFDGRDDARAIEAFASYRREAPDGPFARDALGRLMEAQQRLGDTTAARASALEYLTRFKSGPHAKLAESLAQ